MTPRNLQHRLACTLAPVVGIGTVVLAVATWFAGDVGATVAAGAVLIALFIAALAEANVAVLGLKRPLERLLLTMLLRGAFSMIAIGAAILGGGLDAKLVVLVATPVYLGLILGEAVAAIGAIGANGGFDGIAIKRKG